MKVLLIVAGTFAATVGTYVIVDSITPASDTQEKPPVAVVATASPGTGGKPLATPAPSTRSADDKFSSVAPVAGPSSPQATTTSPFLAQKAFEAELSINNAPASTAPPVAMREPAAVSTPPVAVPPAPTPRPVAENPYANATLVPSAFNPSPANTPGTTKCDFLNKNLPKDTVVVAAGSYSGRALPFQIDQSGSQATQFDVGVHADKPIALLLSAYEPTVWSLGWTKNTRIVAVFATGYHRQAVAGLPPGVPLITTDYAAKDGCIHQYLSRDNLAWINPASRAIFGKDAIRVYPQHKDGLIEITESTRAKSQYLSSSEKTSEMFKDASAPLAGPAGVAEAIKKGILRQATPEDFELVKAAYVKLAAKPSNTKRSGIPPVAQGPDSALPPILMPGYIPEKSYVALKPFVFPAGLYGGHSITVIVPKKTAAPTGNPGHSQVFDLNKEQPCSGTMCW